MHARNEERGARRCAVVEAHVLQRQRAVEVLDAGARMRTTHSFGSVGELVGWLRRAPRSSWPHLVVAEVLPGTELDRELAAVRAMRRAGIRVVLLSALDSRFVIRRVLGVGVDGVVSKQDSERELLDAVCGVLDGGTVITARAAAAIDADPMPKLSQQETRLLELYAGGESLASVAERLGVREDTARKYLKRVKLKYGAQGRPAGTKLELAWRAWEDGLLSAGAFGARV